MCGRYGQTAENLRHYVSQRKLRALQTSIQFQGNKYLGPGNETYSALWKGSYNIGHNSYF
ncbi:MAG: hypothetical protein RLO12_01615 [Fulvivirga sp.]